MTDTETALEYRVAFETALGRSCDDREPTQAQIDAAAKEAREHVMACERDEHFATNR